MTHANSAWILPATAFIGHIGQLSTHNDPYLDRFTQSRFLSGVDPCAGRGVGSQMRNGRKQ